MSIARIDERTLVDHLFSESTSERGGWIVTANLDILRQFARDASARALYREADICVADGMPLVWAAQLAGNPLPERVAGSTLVWTIAERAAREGSTIYLLGGAPGDARATAHVFGRRFGTKIAGISSPVITDPPTPLELDAVTRDVADAKPDIVLVGFGSPKQERVIRHLRRRLPRAWMIGVGASFSFAAGRIDRAPSWMQRSGLEWLHRLSQEPRRLFKRYFVDDMPFAIELLASAASARLRPAGG